MCDGGKIFSIQKGPLAQQLKLIKGTPGHPPTYLSNKSMFARSFLATCWGWGRDLPREKERPRPCCQHHTRSDVIMLEFLHNVLIVGQKQNGKTALFAQIPEYCPEVIGMMTSLSVQSCNMPWSFFPTGVPSADQVIGILGTGPGSRGLPEGLAARNRRPGSCSSPKLCTSSFRESATPSRMGFISIPGSNLSPTSSTSVLSGLSCLLLALIHSKIASSSKDFPGPLLR